MGCDIHLYVERQADNEWGWEHVPDPWPTPYYEQEHSPKDRWYRLFAQLAGVRNRARRPGRGPAYDGRVVARPWFEDRGVPGRIPRVYMWGGDLPTDWATEEDLHSHTWATLAELRAAPWDDVDNGHSGTLRQSGFALWVFGPEMDALVAETGSPERVRVLMAFDN